MTEPGSRYIDFLVPGLIGFGLMSTGLWGIGFSLAEMRTKKLLKRLMATPMRRADFLFSFLLVRALMLLVELPPLLLFARFVFDVRLEGSLALAGRARARRRAHVRGDGAPARVPRARTRRW